MVDQCASFSLGNINREHLICSSDPRYTASEKQNLHPFTRDDAIGAIEEFCSKDLLADPEAKDTSGDFSQSGDWPKGIAKGGKKGVAISVTFPSGISSEFYPTDTPKARHLQAGGPDCRRRLADLIVDGCDGNDASKKMGGSLIESVSRPALQILRHTLSLIRVSMDVFNGSSCPKAARYPFGIFLISV